MKSVADRCGSALHHQPQPLQPRHSEQVPTDSDSGPSLLHNHRSRDTSLVAGAGVRGECACRTYRKGAAGEALRAQGGGGRAVGRTKQARIRVEQELVREARVSVGRCQETLLVKYSGLEAKVGFQTGSQSVAQLNAAERGPRG